MKKIIFCIFTIIYCLILSVSMFGCVGTNTESGSKTENNSSTENNGKNETEVYIPESLENAIHLGTLDFSAWNGDGADSDDREIKSDKISGIIKSVYLASDINYENNLCQNGKVAIENNENSVKAVDVVVCTDHETENVYLATLNVYTRLITNAKDLRMFDQGTIPSDQKKITGCYALTKNIIDPTHAYNLVSIYTRNYYAVTKAPESDLRNLGYTRDSEGNSWKNGEIVEYADATSRFGFAGSFDGRGYSVTINCGSGLFNQLLFGAEVKNLALKNVNMLSGPSAASQQHDYRRRSPIGSSMENYAETAKKIKISNVYISLGETSFYEVNVVTKGLSLLPYDKSGMIALENVIVDVDYANARLLEKGETINPKNEFYLVSYARHLKTNGFAPYTNVFTIVRNQDYDNEEYFTPFYLTDNISAEGIYLSKDYYKENLSVYETWEDFAYDISEEALSSFDNEFWNISGGYPAWRK